MTKKSTEQEGTSTGEAGSDNSTPAGDELVTPEEHAEVTDELEVGDSVTSLPGDEETAARSADMDKPGTEFIKVFVLGPGKYDTSTGYDHEPNKTAVRQQAINSGLWPTGDVRFISNKLHDDKRSRVLSYGVEIEPAHDIREGVTHPEVVGQADVQRDDDGAITGVSEGKPANAEPTPEIVDKPTA